MPKVKVIAVDQHPLMINGIMTFLNSYPDLYERPDGYTDLNVAIHECQIKKPDVLLLGEFSNTLSGAELIAWVSEHRIGANIVAYVEKMPFLDNTSLVAAGARACVWKNSHPAKLNRAIDCVSHGYTYFDSVFVDCQKIIGRGVAGNVLTAREKQILQLIADGKTNKGIARELMLSNKTIESHRLNLMKKLNVHNSIELLKTALRMGVCTI